MPRFPLPLLCYASGPGCCRRTRTTVFVYSTCFSKVGLAKGIRRTLEQMGGKSGVPVQRLAISLCIAHTVNLCLLLKAVVLNRSGPVHRATKRPHQSAQLARAARFASERSVFSALLPISAPYSRASPRLVIEKHKFKLKICLSLSTFGLFNYLFNYRHSLKSASFISFKKTAIFITIVI